MDMNSCGGRRDDRAVRCGGALRMGGVLLGLLSLTAQAQTVPDAGALLRQVESGKEIELPARGPSDEKASSQDDRAASGVQVTVRRFDFSGNTLLGREQLEPVLADYLGRPLDFARLQEAAAVVARTYREAGWVVRVSLPRQDILDGVVTLQIQEAVFGQVLVEGEVPTLVPVEQLKAYVQAGQPEQAPVSAPALERALLLAGDLPGVAVAGVLQRGSAPNQTDLVLRAADGERLLGRVSLDNLGSHSTGRTRLGVTAALNSPARIGDQAQASLVHTEGSDYLRLDYSVPVGSEGWRVGAQASHFRYRLTADEFAALDARGRSNSAGVNAVYPLLRSRQQNLFLNLRYDQNRFDNRSGADVVSDHGVDAWAVALNGNLYDDWGQGGASEMRLDLVRGRVDLSGSPSQASDALTTRTQGQYSRVRWQVSRLQMLDHDLSLHGQYSGQRATKNLDSSEKFFLGGADGVRAYPTSEAGGSEGQLLRLELRKRFGPSWSASAFHDWGRVTVNRNNDFAGAAAVNTYSLRGHGLSLAWSPVPSLNLKVTWARREGENPAALASGRDQDGTLARDRFWLSAALSF